jgi:membrane protein required for colicin V production
VNTLDLILIISFAIGIASGYRKGFLISLFSLLAIFLGILAGFKLMGAAMLTLNDYYAMDEKILPYAAFAVVFVIVLIVVNLLGKMVKSFLDKTVLGNVDQLAGGVLGLLKTVFMISVVFWIGESLSLGVLARWSETSWLYAYTAAFAPVVTGWAGDLIPAFGELLFRSHE